MIIIRKSPFDNPLIGASLEKRNLSGARQGTGQTQPLPQFSEQGFDIGLS